MSKKQDVKVEDAALAVVQEAVDTTNGEFTDETVTEVMVDVGPQTPVCPGKEGQETAISERPMV